MTGLRLALLGTVLGLLLWTLGAPGFDAGTSPVAVGEPSGAPDLWVDLEDAPPGGYLAEGPLLVPESAATVRSEGLRAIGALRPLRLEVTGGGPAPPVLHTPRRLREGRPAGGAIQLHDPTTELLVLRSEAGLEDSLRGRALDRDPGEAAPQEGLQSLAVEYPFVVTPVRAGWTRWEFEVPGGGTPIAWWTWVEEARPLRILAMSGPPGAELRTVVRALEERGEIVETWIHLGRELWVGRDGGLPTGDDGPTAYRQFDAVLVFPGLNLAPDESAALDAAMWSEGTGVLYAGGVPPDNRSPAEATHPAAELGWEALPFEVPGLPPVDLEIGLRDLEDVASEPVALEESGRGRRGEHRVLDSWRWRMEAGEEEAHRDHWGGLVDWLSGGLGPNPVLEILGADLVPGEPLRVRWSSARPPDGESAVVVVRPDPRDPRIPDTTRVDITSADETPFGWMTEVNLPTATVGGHRVEVGTAEEDQARRHPGAWTRIASSGVESSGDRADAAPTSLADHAGRRARTALGSPGGTVLSSDRFRDEVDALRGFDLGKWATVLALALLMTLSVADWGFRRLRGRA